MEEKVLKVFRERETLSICELMLKLQIDKNRLIEILDTLVSRGKLRVEKGRFYRADIIRWEGAFFL